MAGLSTTLNKVATVISGVSIAITGQTKHRARLNAIASYDQSNELFKVRFTRLAFSIWHLSFGCDRHFSARR